MSKINHIAFIMDGNGRWGLKKKRNRNFGHVAGVKTVQKIVKESIILKIPNISFYVFSSENWNRPNSEIKYLFSLINIYFNKEIETIIKNKIKIIVTGRIKELPNKLKKILSRVIQRTQNNDKIIINLAINYGSRNEIVDTVTKLTKRKKKITSNSITKNLYSKLPEPDILIRTGGQKRLSNFMLWQISYTELFFIDKLWPDFNKNDLKNIIKKFHKIKRNFGGI